MTQTSTFSNPAKRATSVVLHPVRLKVLASDTHQSGKMMQARSAVTAAARRPTAIPAPGQVWLVFQRNMSGSTKPLFDKVGVFDLCGGMCTWTVLPE